MGDKSSEPANKKSKRTMEERNLPDLNQENLSEEVQAALILMSMRHDKKWTMPSIVQNDDADETPSKKKANPSKRSEPESPRIQPSEKLPGMEPHPPAVPPVPLLRGLVGECSKPFGKRLTTSDVNDKFSGFSFKAQHVKTHLRNFLEGEDLVAGIQVSVYDMEGKKYPMVFKLWSERVHVLTSGWNKFRQDHGIPGSQKYFVTIWGFRHRQSEKLCFVIDSSRTGSWVEDEDINSAMASQFINLCQDY